MRSSLFADCGRGEGERRRGRGGEEDGEKYESNISIVREKTHLDFHGDVDKAR